MKDRHGNIIKPGDTLVFKHSTSEAIFAVIEKNGLLGINNCGAFFPLSKTDLENAEIQQK